MSVGQINSEFLERTRRKAISDLAIGRSTKCLTIIDLQSWNILELHVTTVLHTA